MWLNDGSHTKEVIQSFFDGNGNFQLVSLISTYFERLNKIRNLQN